MTIRIFYRGFIPLSPTFTEFSFLPNMFLCLVLLHRESGSTTCKHRAYIRVSAGLSLRNSSYKIIKKLTEICLSLSLEKFCFNYVYVHKSASGNRQTNKGAQTHIKQSIMISHAYSVMVAEGKTPTALQGVSPALWPCQVIELWWFLFQFCRRPLMETLILRKNLLSYGKCVDDLAAFKIIN